jgi:hypothetical protein
VLRRSWSDVVLKGLEPEKPTVAMSASDAADLSRLRRGGNLIDHLPGSRTVIGHVVIVCQIVELVGPLGVADQVINPFLHRHLTPDLPPAIAAFPAGEPRPCSFCDLDPASSPRRRCHRMACARDNQSAIHFQYR